MILIVLAFIGLSYYAVVWESYGPGIFEGSAQSRFSSFVAVFIFTILIAMTLWSYFACVTTDPGKVPRGWHPFPNDEEADAQFSLASYGGHPVGSNGQRVRFCRKCKAWKPERAHHDSGTGQCVLRMDHYCIWVLNCVGLLNYKMFLLFLFWTFWACALASGLLINSFIRFFQSDADLNSARPAIVFIAFVVDAAFCLSLLGFLIMHMRLVLNNCTTIEMFEKARGPPWPYSLGSRQNFKAVFGSRPWAWLLPMHSAAEKASMLDDALHEPCLQGPELTDLRGSDPMSCDV
ncbi:hypothetical protein WJX74_002769 [Apatococcus lobatus]|uniref:S-acyltransferase n=1 Tax=Apatococcus lobatus TaxID=904363 RepID=A0AAW1QTD8_9CHLO